MPAAPCDSTKNKTDDPRAWALNPGVSAALRLYKERYRPQAGPESLVFIDPNGQPHNSFRLADLLRAHLMEIGLVRERPELFTTTAERRRIRVHDLRGTFVLVIGTNSCSIVFALDRMGDIHIFDDRGRWRLRGLRRRARFVVYSAPFFGSRW